jgi:hypothetical protein
MRLLGDVSDTLLPTVQIAMDRNVAEQDLARGQIDHAGDHLNGGGLAGPVRPKVSRNLARPGSEADGAHGQAPRVSLRHVSQLEH